VTVETVRLEDRESFITADGSSIRELAGIPSGNSVNQSLAEATVPANGETFEHLHSTSEEIYYFTAGAGRMRLGEETADVKAGDMVVGGQRVGLIRFGSRVDVFIPESYGVEVALGQRAIAGGQPPGKEPYTQPRDTRKWDEEDLRRLDET